MITRLLQKKWKYIIAGIAAPVLVAFIATKAKGAVAYKSNPYVNLKAFLVMIQYAEGTYGKNAYRTLYGGTLFTGYSHHPHRAITKGGITSTAAGAYQILFRTWVTIQDAIGLNDFSPESQDRAAVELIRRRGALEDVLAGRLTAAVDKCRKEWASLPGAGYGQHEHSLAVLTTVYQGAGGKTA